MTRPPKLYQDLLQNPRATVSYRDFERLMVSFGFELQRTRGSHRAYAHAQVANLMIVQPKGADAKSYQVREFLDMVEDHGLTMD